MSEMEIIKEIMKDHDKQILHYEEIKEKLESFHNEDFVEVNEESDLEKIEVNEESGSEMMMEKTELFQNEIIKLKESNEQYEKNIYSNNSSNFRRINHEMKIR